MKVHQYFNYTLNNTEICVITDKGLENILCVAFCVSFSPAFF
jgi:hypothetical protein